MAFGMRLRFVDVICDGSLKNNYVNGNKAGFGFDVRLGYYRGLYLSCIEQFEVHVDGEKVPDQDVTFSINGKVLSAYQLSSCTTEFWGLVDPATIDVIRPGGLASGKHDIKVVLMLRSPYMALPAAPGVRRYMPIDSCGEKTLEVIG